MSETVGRQRDLRLDIIRISALFCVIAVHFFLNSGFMGETVSGVRMYLMTAARSLFAVCVHLFLMLTGYLMNQKQLSKKYFLGIFKVLLTYFICSAVYSVFTKVFLHQDVTVKSFIRSVIGFTGTKYAWYIELYVGLYLLIPFLNLIFNNLKTRRQTLALLIVLFFLTGVPSSFNVFSFDSLEMWTNPAGITSYYKLFPSKWDTLWPLFCYFSGCYLKKYPFRINLGLHSLLLVLACAADGLFNFYKSYGRTFVNASWNYNSSAGCLVIAFLFFSLLLRINPGVGGPKKNSFFKLLSDAVLGAYLLSCIFDIVYYKKLAELVPTVRDRFIYAPVIVLAVFLSSLALSVAVNLIRRLIAYGFSRLRSVFKRPPREAA